MFAAAVLVLCASLATAFQSSQFTLPERATVDQLVEKLAHKAAHSDNLYDFSHAAAAAHTSIELAVAPVDLGSLELTSLASSSVSTIREIAALLPTLSTGNINYDTAIVLASSAAVVGALFGRLRKRSYKSRQSNLLSNLVMGSEFSAKHLLRR